MKLIITFLATTVLSINALAQDISFTKENLQAELDRYTPITEQQDFFALTIKEPVLDLLSHQQRLSIRSAVHINTIFGTAHQGWIKVDGKLRYQRSNHSFYIDDPRITEFHFADLPTAFKPQVQALVEDVLAKAVTDYPLYTLSDKSFEESMAKMMLKSIVIKDNAVVAALSPF